MPLVKIKLGLSHRNSDGKPLKAGDVFHASPAEMESFGDKFILVEDESEPVWTLVEDEGEPVGIGEPVDKPEVPVIEVEINATKGAFGLAAKYAIDLANIVGTGTKGRITVQDVKKTLPNLGNPNAEVASGDAE